MMEPLSFEKGRVVISTQGRDKGRPFLVLENLERIWSPSRTDWFIRWNARKKRKPGIYMRSQLW